MTPAEKSAKYYRIQQIVGTVIALLALGAMIFVWMFALGKLINF